MSAALRALHATLRQTGLDEETRRALYQRITKKRSAKDMSEAERRAVVAELQRLGASNSPRKGRKKLSGKYAGKLQALWIAGWNLGLIRNRDDAALLAFVKRQTGIDHARFLHHADDAAQVIEALKGWLARDGGVQWSNTDLPRGDIMRLNGCKIARAQWMSIDREPDRWTRFAAFVASLTGRAPQALRREADWHPIMNALGKRVRAARREDMP